MKIEFLTLPQFDKKFKEYKKRFKSITKDIKDLSIKLSTNPKSGILIKDNIYKIRLKNSDITKGKSGGYRVLYYYINDEKIIFMYMFFKGDIENISNDFIDDLLSDIKKDY